MTIHFDETTIYSRFFLPSIPYRRISSFFSMAIEKLIPFALLSLFFIVFFIY